MPSPRACLSNLLRKIDFFQNSSFLRYNGDAQYGTATGGLISISILVIFIILFASEGLKTARKQIIFSSLTSEQQVHPEPMTLTTSPSGNFMFVVYMTGLDLNNSTQKYFDIKAYKQTFVPPFTPVSLVEVALVPCTPSHLNFTPEILLNYQKFQLSSSLCPPLGQQIQLQGKHVSDLFKQFKVVLTRCNATADPLCRSDADFQALMNARKQLNIAIPIINTQLNPGSQHYKQLFLDDRQGFIFSDTLGIYSEIYVQEDTVETQESIMPFFSDTRTQKIARVPDRLVMYPYIPAPGQQLVQFTFFKSPNHEKFQRKYNTFDQYLSYVGGLIGTIIGFMFIMGKYSEKAYQISLAHKIFRDQEGTQVPSRSFNFLYFLLMPIKSLLNLCGWGQNWKSTQTYLNASQEISNQLDVTYILRKLNFLDSAIAKLLEEHEVQALYIREKPTITAIKKQRRLHFAPELLQNEQKKDGKGGGFSTENMGRNNSISKQHIMAQDLQGQIRDKKNEEISNAQDLSALQLSSNGSQIIHIKQSVNKVFDESRRGKEISRKILADIKETTLEHLKVAQEEDNNDNIVEVRPAAFEQLPIIQMEKPEKREENDFDFNIEPK